jgi:hypothetical protein
MGATMTTILDRACAERGCMAHNPMVDKDGYILHTTVQLRVKDQYGTQALHPANETAQIFASIAGTKTLTLNTVRHILKLGMNVEYIHDQVKV